MKIAGVVVLYNPDSEVPENVKSYIDSLDRLYVVDNSDYDNSAAFTHEKICYIPNGKNLGIASALNIGAKEALKSGYEWLLTMDQDSRFRDNKVEEMKEFLERMKTDVFLRKIMDSEYEKIGLISPFHRTKMNTEEQYRGIDSPVTVMTSGNIINLKAYEQVGGFRDWLFIDAVDFDYCLNLRNHKYDIFRLTYVELEHNLGDVVYRKNPLKTMYSLNHSTTRRYYIVRNRNYFCDMYKEDFPAYCAAEKGRTYREIIKLIACEKNRLKKLLAMWEGYRDYKRGVKGERPKKSK